MCKKMESELSKWKPYSFEEPAANSIASRLHFDYNTNISELEHDAVKRSTLTNNNSTQEYNDNDDALIPQTNILQIKHNQVEYLPFLRHYYVQMGDEVWHPGADPTVFFEKAGNYEAAGTLTEILELCNYCSYHHFRKSFEQNVAFFLPTNNCETIVGKFEETVLFYIVIFSVSSILLFGFGIIHVCVVIGTTFFFTLLSHRRARVEFSRCSHVKI